MDTEHFPVPPALRWDNIAPKSELHAAFFAAPSGRAVRVAAHGHADFCELFLVTGGAGVHIRGGDTRTALQVGDLCFVKRGDTHAITAPPDSELCWINVAFPIGAWDSFAAFAGVKSSAETVRLFGAEQKAVACVFEETLRAFVRTGTGTRLELAAFLGDVLPYLTTRRATTGTSHTSHANNLPASAPAWLRAAALPLLGDATPDALRSGTKLLQARAGVSQTHLARAVRAATGLSPTQWVTAMRLDRAALLLAVTARPPVAIAADCGFCELGYFYRCFRARFNRTPGAYRKVARGAVFGADG